MSDVTHVFCELGTKSACRNGERMNEGEECIYPERQRRFSLAMLHVGSMRGGGHSVDGSARHWSSDAIQMEADQACIE